MQRRFFLRQPNATSAELGFGSNLRAGALLRGPRQAHGQVVAQGLGPDPSLLSVRRGIRRAGRGDLRRRQAFPYQAEACGG